VDKKGVYIKMNSMLEKLKGKLIVSCQALEGEPLFVPGYMGKMALAARMGGAAGIRANSPQDIRDVKEEVDLPVIGIWKVVSEGSNVYITPTMKEARAVYEAGADIIAVDSTFRKNVEGKYAWELISEIKKELPVLVMADVSTFEEGINAEKVGADIISTTLSGYTAYSTKLEGPDFDLIKRLSEKVKIPVMAEGRIWTVEDAQKALELGAYAIIVGGAITRPAQITERFAKAISK
jgi:N-acylglucosamine-6-phosphate 2-epimerase